MTAPAPSPISLSSTGPDSSSRARPSVYYYGVVDNAPNKDDPVTPSSRRRRRIPLSQATDAQVQEAHERYYRRHGFHPPTNTLDEGHETRSEATGVVGDGLRIFWAGAQQLGVTASTVARSGAAWFRDRGGPLAVDAFQAAWPLVAVVLRWCFCAVAALLRCELRKPERTRVFLALGALWLCWILWRGLGSDVDCTPCECLQQDETCP